MSTVTEVLTVLWPILLYEAAVLAFILGLLQARKGPYVIAILYVLCCVAGLGFGVAAVLDAPTVFASSPEPASVTIEELEAGQPHNPYRTLRNYIALPFIVQYRDGRESKDPPVSLYPVVSRATHDRLMASCGADRGCQEHQLQPLVLVQTTRLGDPKPLEQGGEMPRPEIIGLVRRADEALGWDERDSLPRRFPKFDRHRAVILLEGEKPPTRGDFFGTLRNAAVLLAVALVCVAVGTWRPALRNSWEEPAAYHWALITHDGRPYVRHPYLILVAGWASAPLLWGVMSRCVSNSDFWGGLPFVVAVFALPIWATLKGGFQHLRYAPKTAYIRQSGIRVKTEDVETSMAVGTQSGHPRYIRDYAWDRIERCTIRSTRLGNEVFDIFRIHLNRVDFEDEERMEIALAPPMTRERLREALARYGSMALEEAPPGALPLQT